MGEGRTQAEVLDLTDACPRRRCGADSVVCECSRGNWNVDECFYYQEYCADKPWTREPCSLCGHEFHGTSPCSSCTCQRFLIPTESPGTIPVYSPVGERGQLLKGRRLRAIRRGLSAQSPDVLVTRVFGPAKPSEPEDTGPSRTSRVPVRLANVGRRLATMADRSKLRAVRW